LEEAVGLKMKIWHFVGSSSAKLARNSETGFYVPIRYIPKEFEKRARMSENSVGGYIDVSHQNLQARQSRCFISNAA
jgi:hypothetical protein